MLESDTDAEFLLTALKEILRDRRIGYQAIADAMEVSLPTVKRMLNKPNLPLDRLYRICRIAKIDPIEVFALAEKQRPTHSILTPDQDALFFENPHILSYFLCLIEDGKSPDEIGEDENLVPLSTERYLSSLEKVGLIEREVGTKVRLLISPPIGFGPDSRVLKTQSAGFLKHTVEQVLEPGSDKKVFAILKPFRLQPDVFKEMLGEFSALVDKYAFLSEHPGNRDLPDREDWNVAIAAGPGSPEDRDPIVNF